MAKPTGFAGMVSWRVPAGKGNGLPMKGAKRPGFSTAGVKKAVIKKGK